MTEPAPPSSPVASAPSAIPPVGDVVTEPEPVRVDARVSWVTSNVANPRPVRLTFRDEASGIDFLEVRFTPAEWGQMLAGQGTYSQRMGDGPEATLRGAQYVGKRHEHELAHFRTQEECDAWGAQMLADGWDTYSSHRTNRPSIQGIARRYVAASQTSTGVDDLPADRAASPTAPSVPSANPEKGAV